MCRKVAAVLLPLLLSSASCGGSRVEGALFDGIRTLVEPATITAGQSAAVRCELIGAEPGFETRTEFVNKFKSA